MAIVPKQSATPPNLRCEDKAKQFSEVFKGLDALYSYNIHYNSSTVKLHLCWHNMGGNGVGLYFVPLIEKMFKLCYKQTQQLCVAKH